MNIDQLLTMEAAAEVIGCCRNSIYTYANKGKKNCHGELIRLQTISPAGSRSIFTTASHIQKFLTDTFPVRQTQKYVNTLDYLEKNYGIDTTQARSASLAATTTEQPAL